MGRIQICGLALILLVRASVSASTESQTDNVPDKNDISFLQAKLEFQQSAETVKAKCMDLDAPSAYGDVCTNLNGMTEADAANWCAAHGQNGLNNGKTANTQCCVCGGGTAPYSHVGCYTSYVWSTGCCHGYSGSRMTVPADQRLTTCFKECQAKGYNQFGIEDTTACMCGNADSIVTSRNTGCRNGFGGRHRMDVYDIKAHISSAHSGWVRGICGWAKQTITIGTDYSSTNTDTQEYENAISASVTGSYGASFGIHSVSVEASASYSHTWAHSRSKTLAQSQKHSTQLELQPPDKDHMCLWVYEMETDFKGSRLTSFSSDYLWMRTGQVPKCVPMIMSGPNKWKHGCKSLVGCTSCRPDGCLNGNSHC